MKYVLPAGVLLMAVPVWLSGAPLLVAYLSREHPKGSK
jgi:hypothetical protein